MSVFGDFQRVWVQRFPDSALPAAWEEDVRANLVKHKQKVSEASATGYYAHLGVRELPRRVFVVRRKSPQRRVSGEEKPR